MIKMNKHSALVILSKTKKQMSGSFSGCYANLHCRIEKTLIQSMDVMIIIYMNHKFIGVMIIAA